MYYFKLYS